MESKAIPVEARAICSPQPYTFTRKRNKSRPPASPGEHLKILVVGTDPGDD